MGGVSERPDTFFRVDPASLAKPECFAVRRGDVPSRLDSGANHPLSSQLEARLAKASVPVVALSSILKSIAGGATPKRSDTSLYAESGIRFLRIGNIDDGMIIDRDLKYITESVHAGELERSQLAAGDVLMTITGRVGTAAVVKKEHLPANINQHIARLQVNSSRCLPEFLSEWLNCPTGLKASNRLVSGGTRPPVDYHIIRGLKIPLPASLDRQNALVAVMDVARSEFKAKLSEADALLAGLDTFVLDALGIQISTQDVRRAFATRRRTLNRREINPAAHAPEVQNLLGALNGHSAASSELGAYVDINPKVNTLGIEDDQLVGFIPMGAVSDGAIGEYVLEERLLAAVRKGYTPFENGDILWAKITPCMQNGKSCIVHDLPNGIGFGSTEFHVLRVRATDVLPEFVRELVSQRAIRQAAAYTFTGSAGQQRVPATFLERLPFPLIPETEQREIVEAIGCARAQARSLRTEAEEAWRRAKLWFEEQLLGPPPI